jgi:hypothetical protein
LRPSSALWVHRNFRNCVSKVLVETSIRHRFNIDLLLIHYQCDVHQFAIDFTSIRCRFNIDCHIQNHISFSTCLFRLFLGSSAGFAKIGTFFLATLHSLLSASGHSGQKHGHMWPPIQESGNSLMIFGLYGFSKDCAKIGTIVWQPSIQVQVLMGGHPNFCIGP